MQRWPSFRRSSALNYDAIVVFEASSELSQVCDKCEKEKGKTMQVVITQVCDEYASTVRYASENAASSVRRKKRKI